jgi:hypothetical protein
MVNTDRHRPLVLRSVPAFAVKKIAAGVHFAIDHRPHPIPNGPPKSELIKYDDDDDDDDGDSKRDHWLTVSVPDKPSWSSNAVVVVVVMAAFASNPLYSSWCRLAVRSHPIRCAKSHRPPKKYQLQARYSAKGPLQQYQPVAAVMSVAASVTRGYNSSTNGPST